jgi:sirohydrochlorin cobaltochelatase
LIKLAKIRIHETLASFPESARNQVDVLIVGRGATDPEAIAQFMEAVQKLEKEISFRKFGHSFIALAEPRYKDALPRMLEEGSRHIVVFPFYLFTGILLERIKSQAKELAASYPQADIKIAPYFGSHPLMFELLRDKLNSSCFV